MWPPRASCRQKASVWGRGCAVSSPLFLSCWFLPPLFCLLWLLISPGSEGHRKVLNWLVLTFTGFRPFLCLAGVWNLCSLSWVLRRALLPIPPLPKRKCRLSNLQISYDSIQWDGGLQLNSFGTWPRMPAPRNPLSSVCSLVDLWGRTKDIPCCDLHLVYRKHLFLAWWCLWDTFGPSIKTLPCSPPKLFVGSLPLNVEAPLSGQSWSQTIVTQLWDSI